MGDRTHEALFAVQLEAISKEIICLLMTWKKNILMFSCRTNLQLFSSIMCFTLTEHSNQYQSFIANYLQFMNLAMVTM